MELPLETCRLKSLEHLNLTWTGIKKMPVELKNMTKLRCLILKYMRQLEVLPPNVISCFSNLQMFSMIYDTTMVSMEALQELQSLQYLSEMSISLPTLPAVQKFLTSQKMQKCIQDLEVIQC